MENLKNSTVNAYFTNPIATNLDWAGRVLTYPANFLAKQIAKIVRPMQPGQEGQLRCVCTELAMRVLRVFLCVPLVGISPVGIAGLVLQSIASYARREFVVIRPSEPAPESDKRVEKLKICTFNACLMPEWVQVLMPPGYRLPRERIQAAAQGILKQDIDVLCMQEMFDQEAAKEFIELLKNQYPYIVYNFNHSSLKIGSGLLIASRFPIENPQCWEHVNKIGTERFSRKGSMALTIRLSGNQKICLFNTHLEAGLDNAAKAVPCRVSQLQDIERHLQSYCKDFDLSFFCGDMNISSKKESPDLVKLKEIITINPDDAARTQGTMHKVFPPVHAHLPCPCANTACQDQDIDYIGVLKSSKHQPKLLHSEVDCMNGSSDHLAYMAVFKVTEG